MSKTERLSIKLLPEQKAALESLAQREGEPVAVVLRRLIRAEAQRAGLLTAEPLSTIAPREGKR
jgi:predicted DNA-binding protein